MSRKCLVLLALLLLIVAPAVAQSASHLVAALGDAHIGLDTDKLVWLDNDTLLFEPPSV